MADTYTFTGQARTGWYAYRDLATGRMLEAEPGGTYQIQALEPGLPVPPGNQWIPGSVTAASKTAKASTSETAPASPAGGDV